MTSAAAVPREGTLRAAFSKEAPSFALLFVLSGACGLTYEVVWTRQLVQVFGVTAFAVSTVLVAFMGGMALGAAMFGRIADRAKRPLLLFAMFEAGVGIYGVLFPWLLAGVDRLFSAALAFASDQVLTRGVIRFLFCVILLLPPTVLMGGTLPALGRGLLRRRESIGLGVGVLYFLNTLGAAAGCYVAGFLLLPYAGLRGTTLIAVAVNFLVAFLSWTLDRRAAPVSMIDPQGESVVADGNLGPAQPDTWPLIVAFGSGAAALAFEVAWFRVLVLVFGSTVYSFSAMLSVFLLGLALGSILLGPLADRARAPLRLLVATQGAVALFAFLGSIGVNFMPEFFLRVIRSLGFDLAGMNHTKLLLSALTLLPAGIAFGGTFPVVVRLCRDGGGGAGSKIGRVYAWNTIGAILGSFGAGFVLLPAIGAEWTLRLVVLISILLAFGSVVAEPGEIRPRWAGSVSAALLVLAAALVLSPRWDNRLLGAGAYFDPQRYYDAGGEIVLDRIVSDWEVIHHTAGYNDDIISFLSPKGKFITVNGSPTASDQYVDMFVQRMLAHLPMALHPGPVKRACIVGLGAGVTAGTIGDYEVGKLTAVELEKGVLDSARFFEEENDHVLTNPAVELRIDDGRNYLKRTSDRFDVISTHPNFPSLTGSGTLFSSEYLALCRKRLAPDGVVAEFLPLWRLEPGVVKTIAATFCDAFPHVRFYSSGLNLVMLGRVEPFPPADVDELRRRMTRPAVAKNLAEIGIRGPIELLSFFLFDEAEVRAYAGAAALNTDDAPRVEFFAPRGVFTASVGPNFAELRAVQPSAEARADRLGLRGDDRASFLVLAAAYERACDGAIALERGAIQEALDLLIPVADSGQRYARHLVADFGEQAGLEAQRRGDIAEAANRFGLALRYEPDRHDSLIGLGYVDLFRSKDDEAEALLTRAVELYPRSAGAAYRKGVIRQRKGHVEEAESLYRHAIELNPALSTPYALLGDLLLHSKRAGSALFYLDRGIRMGEDTEGVLLDRAAAQLLLGKAGDAYANAVAASVAYPLSPDALELLARAAEASGRAGEAASARERKKVLMERLQSQGRPPAPAAPAVAH